jgi:hypothetical protein
LHIPITTVLTKMEEQLRQARTTASPHRLREHIAIVRALCDLVLEEEVREMAVSPSTEVSPFSITQEKSERIEIGDDANGPSLFDF